VGLVPDGPDRSNRPPHRRLDSAWCAVPCPAGGLGRRPSPHVVAALNWWGARLDGGSHDDRRTDDRTAPEPAPARPECTTGRRRTIEELPGQTTEAIVVADQHVPAAELGGETIPAVDVPGFTLPGQVLDAGCIVRFDAPGGCLGAYEISSVAIPGVRVPGFTIDPVVVDGQRLADAIVRQPLVVPEFSVSAVRVEQNCEIETTADGRLALVRRRLVRQSAVRRESVRPRCAPTAGVRRGRLLRRGDRRRGRRAAGGAAGDRHPGTYGHLGAHLRHVGDAHCRDAGWSFVPRSPSTSCSPSTPRSSDPTPRRCWGRSPAS
jgi:hypothetical protein